MAAILVTGAAGFIGSRLVAHLASTHDVHALARRMPARAHPRVAYIQHDLTSALDVAKLPPRIDAVIHLAQSREFRRFPDGARDMFQVNVASTAALLEYARQAGASRFVYASSGGVYGSSAEKLLETDPVGSAAPHALNFYLTSKYMSELLVANYREHFRTLVLRCFFVYGPEQRDMLVPGLVTKVLAGDEIAIEGDPGLRVNPIHVADAVRAFEAALAHPRSDVFNVAGDEAVTIRDLVHLIEKVSGVEARVRHTGGSPRGDLVGDTSKMKEDLGVTPRIALADGLREVVDALRAQKAER